MLDGNNHKPVDQMSPNEVLEESRRLRDSLRSIQERIAQLDQRIRALQATQVESSEKARKLREDDLGKSLESGIP